MSSYSSCPTSLTSTGWSTPSSLMEAANDSRASSSKRERGWRELGRMRSRGSCFSIDPLSPATGLATGWLGMRAPRPRPSPLRRGTDHLLGQLPVGDRPPGDWVEHCDRLPEAWRFGKPNRSGYDYPAHLGPEVGPHVLRHLLGQLGPGVVHGEDDGAQLERGVQVALDQGHVLEQLAQAFQGVVLALD